MYKLCLVPPLRTFYIYMRDVISPLDGQRRTRIVKLRATQNVESRCESLASSTSHPMPLSYSPLSLMLSRSASPKLRMLETHENMTKAGKRCPPDHASVM